jgi:hypothetical protein
MKIAILFLSAACVLVGVRANAASFSFDDVARLVSLSDPQISPDGKSIVVVRSTPD